MAIEITLYKMTDDPRKINKTLPSSSGTFLTFSTSYLKDAFTVMDPELTIASSDDLSLYNYMKVGTLNRYYFIRPTIRSNGLWALNAHEDVLQTFQSQIKGNSGIIERTEDENIFNTYLSDDVFESLVYRRVRTILFSEDPFSTAGNGYYLTVTGGGGT